MSYRQEIVGGYFLLARPVCQTVPGKFDPSRGHFLGSFKVTGADRDRSATYDFLLVLRSNWVYLVPFSR